MKKQDITISLFLILFFSAVIVLVSVGLFYLNSHFRIFEINHSISSEVLLVAIVIGISSLIVTSLRQINYLNASLKRWEFCEIYLRQVSLDSYLREKRSDVYDGEMLARSGITREMSDKEIRDGYGEYLGEWIIERQKTPFGKIPMSDINVKTFEVIKLDDFDKRTWLRTPIYTNDPFVEYLHETEEVPWALDRKSPIVEYTSEQTAFRRVIAWLGRNGWEPVLINFDVGEKWATPRGLFKREV